MNWVWTVATEPPLWGEVLSPLAALFAVVVAALFGLRQWKLGERQKLRLELYRELSVKVSAAQSAEIKLASELRITMNELQAAVQQWDHAPPGWSPRLQVSGLIELYNASSNSITEMVLAVEQWEAVNPRWKVYRHALIIGSDERQSIYPDLLRSAMAVLPAPAELQDSLPPWEPPAVGMVEKFIEQAEAITEVGEQLNGWLQDMSIGFQNELVASLFDNRLQLRAPPDPSEIVLDLAQADKVLARLKTQTKGGRRLNELQEAANTRFAESGPT